MATVLIVEDERALREATVEIFDAWGYDTISATDVGEALVLLRSLRPIDVLFTDISLKDDMQGGCTLAQQAIKLRPSLHILYTTGNYLTRQMKAMFVDGTICLRKPYSANQLQQTIVGLLA